MPRPEKQAAPSWWAESHERVLAAARASTWPSRLLDVETRVCELTGDEFYDRMHSEESGLDAPRWLGTLAALTRKELLASIQNDTGDSLPLLSVLLGVTLIAPRSIPLQEAAKDRLFELFMPLSNEPFEVELALAAKPLSEYALGVWAGSVPDQARRAGDAVFARDAYGSRFLVTAPFGYRDSGDPGDAVEVDHWYAWDIDMCGPDVAVDAGAFGSAEEALTRWRDTVGASASGAELAPCPEKMVPVLLGSCLDARPGTEVVQGSERRELVREFHRKLQRARALAWHKGIAVGEDYDVRPDIAAFQEWYGARHAAGARPDLAETARVIIENWGPFRYPDALTFYACSPHRIRYVAGLLRDRLTPEHASAALRLLPEWARWCLSRSGIEAGSVWERRASRAARALASQNPCQP